MEDEDLFSTAVVRTACEKRKKDRKIPCLSQHRQRIDGLTD